MAFLRPSTRFATYEVYPVVDAIGGTSLEAHRAGLERVVSRRAADWLGIARLRASAGLGAGRTVPAIVEIVLTDRLLKEA